MPRGPVALGQHEPPRRRHRVGVPPAASVSLAQLEKRPSAMRLMAMRRSASLGAQQIE